MKPIKPNELFENLGEFLKTKGIELKEGSYVHGIQKSCGILTDAINLGQKGLGRAKEEMDKALEQMRQTIHEKTALKRTAGAASPPPPPPTPNAGKRGKKRTGKVNPRKTRTKKKG